MPPSLPPHVPRHLVRDFSYQDDRRLIQDPWAVFGGLRDAPDIFYTMDLGGYWMVTRRQLIEEVMSRSDSFSSAAATIPSVNSTVQMIPPQLDPPEHGKFRKIIAQRIFSARALANVEVDAHHIMQDLLASAVPRGGGEFLGDFGRPLPISVFLRLLGMPADRLSEFSGWIETFFRSRDPEALRAARQNLVEFAEEWIRSDVCDPSSKILLELKNAQIDGRTLKQQELSAIIVTLFLAGLDTVTAQLSHIVHFLATHPAHRDALIADPTLIPDAIEECLRRFGIANVGRRVISDCDFHGVSMCAGDLVCCSTSAAGMDSSVQADADIVDFRRSNIRRHTAFGAGAHLCVGAFLARTEIRVLLEEMLPRVPRLRLQTDAKIVYIPGKVITMSSLPLDWT